MFFPKTINTKKLPLITIESININHVVVANPQRLSHGWIANVNPHPIMFRRNKISTSDSEAASV